MIILLDGSKGAGKTSASEFLLQKLGNTVYLGLDAERRKLPIEEKTRVELNKEAFEIILVKTKEFVVEGKDVIVDCILTKERISQFEDIAQTLNTVLYKFFLKAERGTLLDRVRTRDIASNRETNLERFDQMYEMTHAKEFDGFIIIETDSISVEEVVRKVLETLK